MDRPNLTNLYNSVYAQAEYILTGYRFMYPEMIFQEDSKQTERETTWIVERAIDAEYMRHPFID